MIIRLAIILFAVLITAQISSAQNIFKSTVQDEETKQAIAGAKVSVRDTNISATTDASGKAELAGIPDGEQIIEIFADRYEIQQLNFTFPLTDASERLIPLKVNKVGDVVVNTTRTGREIDDTPTRVEAIDEEEVDEKSNMRSANVSMILNESTGIKVQQTSATSFTQTIRIQGLDGRYTQILKTDFRRSAAFPAV